MRLSPAPPLCAKCGSHRTRPVGPARLVDNGVYYRCDACEYVFVVGDDGHDPQERRVTPGAASPACPKCERPLRIIGQSGNPPVVHYECRACGYLSSKPLD